MNKTFLITMLLLATITSTANAQFYVGAAGVDQSYDEGSVDWPRPTTGSGFGQLGTANRRVFDKANDEAKLFVGYRVNRHFAVEAAYQDLGQIKLTQSIFLFDPPGTEIGEGAQLFNSTEVAGPSLSVLGILPFNIKRAELEVFLKAGAFAWTADSTARQQSGTIRFDTFQSGFVPTADPLQDSDSASGVSAVLGLGLVVKIWKGLAVRAELEKFSDVGDGARRSDLATPENTLFNAPLTLGLETSFTTLSGGLLYRF